METFNKVLFDLDGVLLDSEDRIVRMKNERDDLSWDQFFDTVDWKSLYEEALEVNDSLKILRTYQEMNPDNSFIVSKSHTLEEGRWKLHRIRKEGIVIPMFIVPPHVKKSDIFIPSSDILLVDDSTKQIGEWRESSGTGYLFDPEDKKEDKQKVKSLEFLLRR